MTGLMDQKDTGTVSEKPLVYYSNGPRAFAVFLITLFLLLVFPSFWFWLLKEVSFLGLQFGDFSDFLLFAVPVILSMVGLVFLEVEYGQHFFTRVFIFDDMIICRRFGREIKRLTWERVFQTTVCKVRLPRQGISGELYLVFSSHSLTEEERSRAIFYAGEKNDIVVVLYSPKRVRQIKCKCPSLHIS